MDANELQSLADRIAAHRVKHDALAAEHEELIRQVDELLAQREASKSATRAKNQGERQGDRLTLLFAHRFG